MVANVAPFASIAVANGAAVDVTMRYYAPQMELGGSPTSRILPSVGTPAVSVRGDDITFRTLGPNFNRLVGSYVIRFTPYYQQTPLQGIMAFDDNTFANRLYVYIDTNTNTVVAAAFSATTLTIFSGVGSVVFGQENVLAI